MDTEIKYIANVPWQIKHRKHPNSDPFKSQLIYSTIMLIPSILFSQNWINGEAALTETGFYCCGGEHLKLCSAVL